MLTKAEIKAILESAAVFVPKEHEGIRIDYCDDDYFCGTGEDSGAEYQVEYAKIDQATCQIFKLEKIFPL